MSRPKSDFDALREDLRKVYDGDPWHGSSIMAVLAGVDAQTAASQEEEKRRGARPWEDLAAAQKELESTVESLDAKDLFRWIEDQRGPSFGDSVTVGTLIRGLLQHHTYHQGQIAILKRAAESAKG